MGVLCLGIVSWGSMPGGNFITSNQYNYERSKRSSAIIGIAAKEVGVRESTRNYSPRIGEYLNYVGFKQAAPWCAGFVSWCHNKIGLGAPRSAWSPSLFPSNRLARDGLPGMVIGIYFPSMGRIAHVGLIERVQGSLIFSIEGNTNVAGSREGDGVMRKVRHKRTVAKYADWLLD
jgi:hypothetical protein